MDSLRANLAASTQQAAHQLPQCASAPQQAGLSPPPRQASPQAAQQQQAGSSPQQQQRKRLGSPPMIDLDSVTSAAAADPFLGQPCAENPAVQPGRSAADSAAASGKELPSKQPEAAAGGGRALPEDTARIGSAGLPAAKDGESPRAATSTAPDPSAKAVLVPPTPPQRGSLGPRAHALPDDNSSIADNPFEVCSHPEWRSETQTTSKELNRLQVLQV